MAGTVRALLSFITFCAVAGRAQAGNWDLGATYNAQILSNLDGGIATGTRYLDKLSLGVIYNAPKFPGLRTIASIQYVNGVQFTGALVGDIQTVSNIEAPRGVRLYDAALQWTAPDDSAMLRLGFTDLNEFFDVQDPGLLFLNSSNGIGTEFAQTGANGPSIFPTTALAVVGGVQFGGGWSAQAGLFNAIAGNPEDPGAFVAVKTGGGALLVGEVDFTSASGAWKFEFGGWGYTAAFETLPGPGPGWSGGNAGAYVIAEARLFEAGPRRLDGWVRFGFANDRINDIGSYAGGGLVLAAPFAGRDDDAAGIAVSRAVFGDPARAASGFEAAETVVELTYSAQLTDWLSIQPDVQICLQSRRRPRAAQRRGPRHQHHRLDRNPAPVGAGMSRAAGAATRAQIRFHGQTPRGKC